MAPHRFAVDGRHTLGFATITCDGLEPEASVPTHFDDTTLPPAFRIIGTSGGGRRAEWSQNGRSMFRDAGADTLGSSRSPERMSLAGSSPRERKCAELRRKSVWRVGLMFDAPNRCRTRPSAGMSVSSDGTWLLYSYDEQRNAT